jgi:hypothetical protein
MQTWRNREHVAVRLVLERKVQISRITVDSEIAESECRSFGLGSVAVSAVENWRVQSFRDIGDDCLGSSGEVLLDSSDVLILRLD